MSSLQGCRVLITGGAGLVGSHIADLLVRELPKEIVIFDNFVRGQRKNLQWALANGPVSVIEGDLRDRSALAEAMRGVDVVFHQGHGRRDIQCAFLAEHDFVAQDIADQWVGWQ